MGARRGLGRGRQAKGVHSESLVKCGSVTRPRLTLETPQTYVFINRTESTFPSILMVRELHCPKASARFSCIPLPLADADLREYEEPLALAALTT